MKLTPAGYVIYAFGGARPLARALGKDHSTVVRWNTPKSRDLKGCDGFIPHKAQQLILKIAKRKKIDIRPEDLIVGREVPKEDFTSQR